MTARQQRKPGAKNVPSSKPPELSSPDGIVARWYIMGAIVQDSRSRMIHSQVAWPILEAYYDKMGKGQSSYRYLAAATRLTHGSIKTATSDLVEWGYFTREIGSGKAPTTYVPNWEYAASTYAAGRLGVLQPPSALPPPSALLSPSVLQPQSEGVLQPQNPTDDSVLQPQNQTLLSSPLNGLTKEGDEKDDAGGLVAPDAAFPLPKRWTIVAAEMVEESDGTPDFVAIDLESDDGSAVTDYFEFDPLTGFEPDSRWDDLVKYAELLCEIGATEDLVGVRVFAFGSENDMTYISELEALLRLPRNDNDRKVGKGPTLPAGPRPWVAPHQAIGG